MDRGADIDREHPSRNMKNPYQFSAEEMRVMRECNRDSFFQRCVPLAGLLGGSAYYAVKTGYLRGHPRFGATPKVAVAVIVGYFLGKFSYQQKCAEKLMQLPNSHLGEILRQRRKGHLHETLEPGFGPGMALAPFSGMRSSDTYSDVNPSTDIDATPPQYDGLDDSQRPSVDNPIYDEEMPPLHKQPTTYDELRRKNRDEYQQKRTGNYNRSNSVTQTNVLPAQAREEAVPRVRTNIYGDPIS